MKRFPIAVAFAITLAFGSAQARNYSCACKSDQKKTVEALSGHNYKCVETFQSNDKEVTVLKNYLKLKVDKSNQKQDDGDLDFELRPRNGYCLIAVKDVGDDSPIASSSGSTGECNASKWLKMKNLSLHQKGNEDPKDWTGTFKASPSLFSKSNRSYYGTVYYVPGDDGKRYLAAACLEN